jgi:hypothetical protein
MADSEEIMNALTIRQAMPSDETALEQLATLDSSRPLHSPVLVGEVGDELWAAVSLHDFAVVSDPFRPSGELAFVLVERARQLSRPKGRRGVRRLAHGLPRLAA